MGAAFQLERFERVDASPSTALLRLAGVFAADAPDLPHLVVGERRVAPLPDPGAGSPAAGRVWRAAFPVPSALLDVRYALDAGGGAIELPAPAVAEPRLAELAVELERERERREDLETLLLEALDELARLRAAAS